LCHPITQYRKRASMWSVRRRLWLGVFACLTCRSILLHAVGDVRSIVDPFTPNHQQLPKAGALFFSISAGDCTRSESSSGTCRQQELPRRRPRMLAIVPATAVTMSHRSSTFRLCEATKGGGGVATPRPSRLCVMWRRRVRSGDSFRFGRHLPVPPLSVC
jgi:hypothetical protein